jgi:peptidoglycan/LPS O-acetylase OafA/YrhL
MKLKYYYNLDGIRGVAALIVVIFHTFSRKYSGYVSNLSSYTS